MSATCTASLRSAPNTDQGHSVLTSMITHEKPTERHACRLRDARTEQGVYVTCCKPAARTERSAATESASTAAGSTSVISATRTNTAGPRARLLVCSSVLIAPSSTSRQHVMPSSTRVHAPFLRTNEASLDPRLPSRK